MREIYWEEIDALAMNFKSYKETILLWLYP